MITVTTKPTFNLLHKLALQIYFFIISILRVGLLGVQESGD